MNILIPPSKNIEIKLIQKALKELFNIQFILKEEFLLFETLEGLKGYNIDFLKGEEFL